MFPTYFLLCVWAKHCSLGPEFLFAINMMKYYICSDLNNYSNAVTNLDNFFSFLTPFFFSPLEPTMSLEQNIFFDYTCICFALSFKFLLHQKAALKLISPNEQCLPGFQPDPGCTALEDGLRLQISD